MQDRIRRFIETEYQGEASPFVMADMFRLSVEHFSKDNLLTDGTLKDYCDELLAEYKELEAKGVFEPPLKH